MKKTVLVVVTIFALSNVYSQFEKGSKWIAGSLSLSGSNTIYPQLINDEKTSSFRFGFRLSYSWFVNEKTMRSVFIGYDLFLNKDENNTGSFNKNINHQFYLGTSKTFIYPLLGKVYGTCNTNVSVSYGFGNRNTNNSVSNTKSFNWGINTNIGLGLMYKATDRLIVTTSLNDLLYSILSTTINKSNTANGYVTTSETSNAIIGTGLSGFNLGSLQFGLMYKLKK